MKKILYTVLAVFFLYFSVNAQQNDQRTVVTKIADLLALQPASDSSKLADAMQQLDAFSATEIASLLKTLSSESASSRSLVEYATTSYSFFVATPGKEVQRLKFVEGSGLALKEISDKNNQRYIISLLEHSGKDEAVNTLVPYLEDDSLYSDAARALAAIGSPPAGSNLLNALERLDGPKKIAVVQALGFMGYADSEFAIRRYIGLGDGELERVALFALSEIAVPSSLNTLKEAAEKADYAYDLTNATSAYINYANKLLAKSETALVEKIAKGILKDAMRENQVPARIASLKLLSELDNSDYTKTLIQASRHSNLAYRSAAVEFAVPLLNESTIRRWLNELKKAENENKPAIISLLASSGNTSILSDLQPYMHSDDEMVSVSAIQAFSKLAKEDAAMPLLQLWEEADGLERRAIYGAFLTMEGADALELLTDALPEASPQIQALIMELLGKRAYAASFKNIWPMTENRNTEVRKAAYDALETVSRSQNLNDLFGLLQRVRSSELAAVQHSIIGAIESSPSQEADIANLSVRFKNADETGKLVYLPIFSGIGGHTSLNTITNVFESKNPELEKAAVVALANWKDQSAIPPLIKLSREITESELHNRVLRGLLRVTAQSDLTDERKVLIYRDAMEVAVTVDQRKAILNNIQHTQTYSALRFAASFLDDKDLQGSAANTVMNIALGNKDLIGKDVRDYLTKAEKLLSGSESSYLREAIRKHLDQMPKEGFKVLFDGTDLTHWTGNMDSYVISDEGTLAIYPTKGSGGNLYTKEQFGDFVYRFDFRLTPGANNGIGIRAPLTGDAAYQGMEIQVLDNDADMYKRLADYQYHGSVYGIIPAKRGFLKPVGEWNQQEIYVKGDSIKVTLNGTVILDGSIKEAREHGTLDKKSHPGLERTIGHIGFLGHGSEVHFKNIRIKEL